MWKSLSLYLILFSTSSLALESSDVLKTQILKIYNKNVLVINRGIEDAIFKADHGKLTSDDGFIARGICIKTTMLTSHWKIYRVVRPQLVSKDTEYRLNSINQSEIPRSLIKFSKVDFSKYFNDYNDDNRTKQLDLQKDRVARFDLPKNAKQTQYYKDKTKSDFDKFVDRNFDDATMKEDLQSTYLNIFASPLSWQTRYDQKEIHYGLNFFNLGKKFKFVIRSIETQRKILDPVTKSGISSKSSHHDAHFELHRPTKYFSFLSFAEYDKEKIGNLYYPYDHYQIGILGVKLHIMENDPLSSLVDISYTPAFDNMKFTNPFDPNGDLIEREGIRHHFKLRMYGNFTPKLSNKTEITYAPFLKLSSSDFDYEDTFIQAKSMFSYNLGRAFYWDYIIKYERDDLQAEVYQISADNTTQTFRLRYQFDL